MSHVRCIESGRGHSRRGRAVLFCIVVLSTDFNRGNPNIPLLTESMRRSRLLIILDYFWATWTCCAIRQFSGT